VSGLISLVLIRSASSLKVRDAINCVPGEWRRLFTSSSKMAPPKTAVVSNAIPIASYEEIHIFMLIPTVYNFTSEKSYFRINPYWSFLGDQDNHHSVEDF
jgi:hypothetical protein